MGRKRKSGVRIRQRRPGYAFSVRISVDGEEVELSTGSRDPEIASANAAEILRKSNKSRYRRKPRGIVLPSTRVCGVAPVVNPPEVAGVYFAWCPLLSRFVKIGWSRNIRQRLRHLRTGLPGPLYLLSFIEGPKRLESELHAQLSEVRVKGEWFRTGEAVARAIKNGRVSGT